MDNGRQGTGIRNTALDECERKVCNGYASWDAVVGVFGGWEEQKREAWHVDTEDVASVVAADCNISESINKSMDDTTIKEARDHSIKLDFNWKAEFLKIPH